MTTTAIEAGARAAWTPDQFWQYVTGFLSEFESEQMRAMLAERGLAVVPASAVAEMRERCLSIVRKYTAGNGDEYDELDIGAAVTAKEIERQILDLSPAGGDYVLVPRELPLAALVAAKKSLFSCSEDPEFEDVYKMWKAILNVVENPNSDPIEGFTATTGGRRG